MSRMRNVLLAGAVAAVAATGLAMAQPGPGPGPQGGPGAGPGFGPGMMGRGPGPGMHHHGGGRGGAGGFMLGEAFARADANNDGKVTREEGQVWLQARFTEIDTNRDGGVTLDEMRAYSERIRAEFGIVSGRGPGPGAGPGGDDRFREAMEARGAMMIRFLDANGDGRVSFDELRPMAEALFRMADRDNDGALTRAEVVPNRRGPGGPGRFGPPPATPGAPPVAPGTPPAR